MKIVFPEYKNAVVSKAIANYPRIEAIGAENLAEACEKVRNGEADAMIAGIDYSSRDVILACRDGLGMSGKTFSSCVVLRKENRKYVLADIATCKHPNEEQLFDIICQTYETAKRVLDEEPKIAVLSFSTLGSGGKDETMETAKNVISRVRTERPEIIIDGEMQLDAAANLEVGKKKAPNSQVAGRANVLICPDINSGNILYKAMEQFGGFSAAGPILQGFDYPASDLSRGSTVEDVVETIAVVEKLI